MSMTEMPVAAAATKPARIQALLDWRDDLASMNYGIMSPEDLLREIKNYPIFARSRDLPEFLVELQEEAKSRGETNEKNKKRGKDMEVFAAAGVIWLINREVDRLRALTS